MTPSNDYRLGMVLHKVTDTHRLQVRLDLRNGNRRYLTIAKSEPYEDEWDLVGWVALYARHLGPLRRALRKAHAVATILEHERHREMEFSCSLDGEDWVCSTKQVRVILEAREGIKVLTLLTFHQVKSSWIRDEVAYDCELGVDDLKDILDALDGGVEKHVDTTRPHRQTQSPTQS